ncbi:hypothetical protein CCR75_004426 [Bremia lactucae]|uniref:Uncharacterized protein n=1 Tax=Bremia lactucae TaxID=4779 RepID=A0A976FRT1_BRELC|nr:hypothetical protein CCR75_004426 [Bremia lactucae]
MGLGAALIILYAKFHPRDTISSFILPSQAPWPEHAWGINLGVVAQWNSKRHEATERDWRAQVLLANDVYQYEDGNKVLRDTFVVP